MVDICEDADVQRLDRMILHLDRATNGDIQPRVQVLDHQEITIVEDLDEAARINHLLHQEGKKPPPPYIKMAEDDLPSPEDCIKLFHLDTEQAFAFLIISNTLLQEKMGMSPPQLKMVVSGQAGTGKSECMKAILWFSFQHTISDYIATSSFMWKAAILVIVARYR